MSRTALVIGGGPSAKKDLAALAVTGFRPECVLSANEHGFYQDLYEVDFIVHVSERHHRRRVDMVPYLRTFKRPLVSKYPSADVPLAPWDFLGNAGETAIAVAARWGFSRVVVVGLDGFETGPLYFHGRDTHTRTCPSFMELPLDSLRHQMAALCDLCRKVEVRPLRGYLTRLFPAYSFKGV